MKKIILILIATIISFISVGFISSPTFADCPDGYIPVSILDGGDGTTGTNGEKCRKEAENGDDVQNILYLVRDIMSVGVGILGVIGITIVGIQYLTAGGNEDQTRKAKRRLLEIVIGLVAYVIIIALLTWLLPGFGDQ